MVFTDYASRVKRYFLNLRVSEVQNHHSQSPFKIPKRCEPNPKYKAQNTDVPTAVKSIIRLSILRRGLFKNISKIARFVVNRMSSLFLLMNLMRNLSFRVGLLNNIRAQILIPSKTHLTRYSSLINSYKNSVENRGSDSYLYTVLCQNY